jgi:excisionase family DNA binding protein
MDDEEQVEKPYKVREYAELWRVTPNAVYTAVRRGELPSVRFGRVIRIPRDAGDRRLKGETATLNRHLGCTIACCAASASCVRRTGSNSYSGGITTGSSSTRRRCCSKYPAVSRRTCAGSSCAMVDNALDQAIDDCERDGRLPGGASRDPARVDWPSILLRNAYSRLPIEATIGSRPNQGQSHGCLRPATAGMTRASDWLDSTGDRCRNALTGFGALAGD